MTSAYQTGELMSERLYEKAVAAERASRASKSTNAGDAQ
jgi:hypothetical protein